MIFSIKIYCRQKIIFTKELSPHLRPITNAYAIKKLINR